MKRLFLLLALSAIALPVRAQTAADSTAIRRAALDYIEGWYTGDAERMKRAVHPELVKRIVRQDPRTGRVFISGQGASQLVTGTARGGGTDTPRAGRQKDVVILDIFQNAASVKVTASDWVDYLHMARFDGQWKIVNVLWELKSAERD